ncbi:unnamed protein product [Linum trigynum]|uniref:Uncharacterized protein n=1 Tax=Linum trigynum TaxID=586398 RepID=A0AAV2CI22_9ROSI
MPQALTMEGGTMENTLPRLDLMTSKLIKRTISWDKIRFVVANIADIAQSQAPFPSFSPLFPISLRKLKIEAASVSVEMVRSAAAMVSRDSPLFLPLLSNFTNPISRIGLGVWWRGGRRRFGSEGRGKNREAGGGRRSSWAGEGVGHDGGEVRSDKSGVRLGRWRRSR